MDILTYVSERSPRGANALLGRIEARIGSLSENPELGPAAPGLGSRMLAITRTDYVAFYRLQDEEIIVLRLLHGARDRRDLADIE